MIKTKKVVKYDTQHCMYYVVTELDADESTKRMLKNITLHKGYCNYDVRYKNVERYELCEGIYEAYMTGALDSENYFSEDIKVIREVFHRPDFERKIIFELLDNLCKDLNDVELEELLEGCK